MKKFAVIATIAIAGLHGTVFAAVPEPTEEEIVAMTERGIVAANQPIIDYHKRLDKGEVPNDMLIKLNGIKKLGCSPVEGSDAHDCKLQMDVTVPRGGRNTREVSVRFSKVDGQWRGVR